MNVKRYAMLLVVLINRKKAVWAWAYVDERQLSVVLWEWNPAMVSYSNSEVWDDALFVPDFSFCRKPVCTAGQLGRFRASNSGLFFH